MCRVIGHMPSGAKKERLKHIDPLFFMRAKACDNFISSPGFQAGIIAKQSGSTKRERRQQKRTVRMNGPSSGGD
jgi:hypothetical protein